MITRFNYNPTQLPTLTPPPPHQPTITATETSLRGAGYSNQFSIFDFNITPQLSTLKFRLYLEVEPR